MLVAKMVDLCAEVVPNGSYMIDRCRESMLIDFSPLSLPVVTVGIPNLIRFSNSFQIDFMAQLSCNFSSLFLFNVSRMEIFT
jgi:hypothetical protein